MDDIPANVDSEVATDGARLSGQGVGGPDELAAGGDDLLASQTMATTGPETMYSTSPPKKGLEDRSA